MRRKYSSARKVGGLSGSFGESRSGEAGQKNTRHGGCNELELRPYVPLSSEFLFFFAMHDSKPQDATPNTSSERVVAKGGEIT
jgi:hypothetical protein